MAQSSMLRVYGPTQRAAAARPLPGLGYWNIGILGCWDVGMLGLGILGYWDVGILGYWNI
jgi:hypothetical protein